MGGGGEEERRRSGGEKEGRHVIRAIPKRLGTAACGVLKGRGVGLRMRYDRSLRSIARNGIEDM